MDFAHLRARCSAARTAALLLGVALASGSARADGPSWVGRIALEHGYPGGDLSGDTYYVSNVFRSRSSLRLGAALRTWGRRLEWGGSAMLGAAPENPSVSPDGWFEWGRSSALLAEVTFHPWPDASADPWIRLAGGVTRLEAWYDAGGRERWTGFVFPRVEVGARVLSAGRLGIAPYAGLEVGRFTRYASAAGAYTIPNPALHYWGSLGVALTITDSR